MLIKVPERFGFYLWNVSFTRLLVGNINLCRTFHVTYKFYGISFMAL